MAEHYCNTPRITYEFPDCSMPMAFDTYNNCSFCCMYCFAQNQRGIGSKKKEYLHKEVKDVSVERIKRMFIDPDKHGGDFAPYIKARKVMQWGSMSDIKLDAENLLRARLEKAMNLGTREKYSKYYTMSAADYMKWCWNNPQAAHSPYKMFEGAMVPADERDSEGNIVYKYNGAKF